jgi:hypothetical protein
MEQTPTPEKHQGRSFNFWLLCAADRLGAAQVIKAEVPVSAGHPNLTENSSGRFLADSGRTFAAALIWMR